MLIHATFRVFILVSFPEFWFDAIHAAMRPLARVYCSTLFLLATSAT
jgi:hypothetical protein